MTVRRLTTVVFAFTLVLVACAEDPPAGGSGPTPTPSRDAGDVVLRLSYEGGFVPAGFPLLDVPAFTLANDGTLIVPGAQAAIYPGPALPAIVEREVDQAAIDAIVARAREAGLGDRDLDLGDTGDLGIADASTAVFTLTIDGVTTTAEVYALGLEGDPATMPGLPAAQVELRRDLAALVADLQDLSWVEAAGGALGEERMYGGGSARLLIGPLHEDPELPQEAVRWPLDASLRTFGDPVAWDPETRCAIVAAEDWIVLREAAEGANQLTPWTDGGADRAIAFRPLLPDELSSDGC